MDGYGAYVWSSFLFTLTSFAYLYFVTQLQYVREKNKWIRIENMFYMQKPIKKNALIRTA